MSLIPQSASWELGEDFEKGLYNQECSDTFSYQHIHFDMFLA